MSSSAFILGMILLLSATPAGWMHLTAAAPGVAAEGAPDRQTTPPPTAKVVEPAPVKAPDTQHPAPEATPAPGSGETAPPSIAAPVCDPADRSTEACLREQIEQFWKYKEAMKLDECYKMLTKESQTRIDLVKYIKRQNVRVSNWVITRLDMPAGEKAYADLKMTYDIKAMGYSLKKVSSRQRWFYEDGDWKALYQPSNPMSSSVTPRGGAKTEQSDSQTAAAEETAAKSGTPEAAAGTATTAGQGENATPDSTAETSKTATEAEKAKTTNASEKATDTPATKSEALLKALKLKEPPKPSFDEAMKNESTPPPPPKK